MRTCTRQPAHVYPASAHVYGTRRVCMARALDGVRRGAWKILIRTDCGSIDASTRSVGSTRGALRCASVSTLPAAALALPRKKTARQPLLSFCRRATPERHRHSCHKRGVAAGVTGTAIPTLLPARGGVAKRARWAHFIRISRSKLI